MKRALLVVSTLLSMLLPASPAIAQDTAISRRQPIICPASQYPYYSVADRQWFCSTTEPAIFNATTLTTTSTELNKLAGVTAGTTAASKALVVDANKRLDVLVLGTLNLGAAGGTAVTSTAAELNTNAGVTAGTVTASKTVVADASAAVTGLKTKLGGGASATLAGTMVGGLIDQTSTASGTVQSTEYTLNSVTLPASAFNANGRGIQCTAYGTSAANANAKNYKVYFGATAVATLTGTTDNAKDYVARFTVLRTGSSTQSGVAEITSDVGAPDAMAVTTALAETDTGAIIVSFKSANTAAAAASATGKGLSCVFIN